MAMRGLGGGLGLSGEVIEKTGMNLPGMGLLKPPFPMKFMPKPMVPKMPGTPPSGQNPLKKASVSFKDLLKQEVDLFETNEKERKMDGSSLEARMKDLLDFETMLAQQ